MLAVPATAWSTTSIESIKSQIQELTVDHQETSTVRCLDPFVGHITRLVRHAASYACALEKSREQLALVQRTLRDFCYSWPEISNRSDIARKSMNDRNLVKISPHTMSYLLGKRPRMTICSADSSSVRRA